MYHHTQLQPSFPYLSSISRPEPHSYLMTAPPAMCQGLFQMLTTKAATQANPQL